MTLKTSDFSGLLYYNPGSHGFNAVPEVTIHCPDSMNEGDTITVDVVTWGIPDGTALFHLFPMYGTNLTPNRFNVSQGFTVLHNRASFTVTVNSDHTTSLDGQSFDIVIKKTLTGPALATKYGVNVNDTSQTPLYPTGLIRKTYTGYYYTGAEASQWFKDKTPTETFDNAGLGDNDPGEVHVQGISYEWVGHFSPPATDDYTFHIMSDDRTLVWIGDNAISAYTNSNANINCSTSQFAQSSAITMTGGDFIPIRIQFGNDTGGGELHVSWSSTAHPTATRNFNWLLYHDVPIIAPTYTHQYGTDAPNGYTSANLVWNDVVSQNVIGWTMTGLDVPPGTIVLTQTSNGNQTFMTISHEINYHAVNYTFIAP